jgi:hypothetical protein
MFLRNAALHGVARMGLMGLMGLMGRGLWAAPEPSPEQVP